MAKRAFRAGNQAYAAGKYLAAARAYENAHEALPLAACTFSAAQAYRRQYFVDHDAAWLERARALYQRYLDEQGSGGRIEHAVTHLSEIELLLARRDASVRESQPAFPTEILVSSSTPHARASIDGGPSLPIPVVSTVTPGSHRVKVTAPGFEARETPALAVQSRLAVVPVELRALPGLLRIETDAGTEIWLDGGLLGTHPLGSSVSVETGEHRLVFQRRGQRTQTRHFQVRRDETLSVSAHLRPTDQRIFAYVGLGGASALALLGGVTSYLSLRAERSAESAKSGLDQGQSLSAADRDRYNEDLSRRNDYRNASIGLFAGAAVSAGIGALLYVFDPPASAAPKTEKARARTLRFGSF